MDRPLRRLRTTEPVVSTAIRQGQRRSSTFAMLVDAVERSDMIVYVERVRMRPHHMEGYLAPSGAQSRYLRVRIAMGMGPDRTIVVLAHELQHVREVLDAGGGTDQAAFDSLYMRIGERRLTTPTHRYETAAAHDVMEIVGREIRASAK
jgi:hypothetical protein